MTALLAALRRAAPFVGLFVFALLARGYVNSERLSPGHGDVADYYSVATNLFQGRGFLVDYIWTFIVDPKGIPNPSNTWWMPLPSILTAIGFFVAGDASYSVAKWTMIVVASLLPFVTYLTARELLGSRKLAFAAAIVATGFHLFLDQTCAPLSYGPYTLFGGLALFAILASRRQPRWFPFVGLLIGISYLSRGDSLVLWLPAALVFVRSMRFRSTNPAPSPLPGAPRHVGVPIGFGKAILAVVFFLAVIAPWLARNVSVMGRPTPAGQAKMIWLKDYSQWYTSRAETLTPASYFELGPLGIIDQKTWAIGEVTNFTLTCLYRSVARPVTFELTDPSTRIWIVGLLMSPLLWVGLVVLWRRGEMIPFAYLGALLVFYGVLFSAISEQSYRTGLFTLLPTFVCAIVAGLNLCFSWLRRFSGRLADGLLLVAAVMLALANVLATKPFLDSKAQAIERMLAPYREFGEWAKQNGFTDKVCFNLNPWEFTLETGIPSVMVPPENAPEIIEIARRFDVTHLAIDDASVSWLDALRPALTKMIAGGVLRRVEGSKGLVLYEFREDVLKPQG